MTNARPTAAPADRPWLTAGLLGLLTFLVFLPAVRCGFVDWDDDVYVTDNPLVLGGLTAEGVRGAFTSVVFHNWAPLTILSYQLDTTLFGRDPWGFHLTNVVIHAVSAGLLVLVLFRMTGRMAASLLAATLFAVHPLRVESVVWISERKDVLCVLFLMLALLAYDRYTRNPGGLRYLAVAAAMLAGLLAKSTLVTLPLLLLILDAWPLGRVRGLAADGAAASRPARPLWWLVAEKIPLLCLSLLFSRITLAVQAAAVASPTRVSFLRARLPNAIASFGWYLGASILTTGLHPVCHRDDVGPSWAAVAAAAAAILAAACMTVATGRRRPAIPFGLAWFVVALVPVIGLVQVGFQSHADRFTYVPHVGLAVAAAWGACDLAGLLRLPARAGIAAAVAACLLLVVLTERQIAVWTSGDSLWRHVLSLEPDNPVALGRQAAALASAGRIEEAERLYLRSLRQTEYPWSILGLARLYQKAGDLPRAARYGEWAGRVSPDDPLVVEFLRQLPVEPSRPSSAPRPVIEPAVRRLLEQGSVHLNASRFAAALEAFGRAIAADPGCGPAHNLAGIAALGLDRGPEAAEHFRAATRLDPGNFGFQVNLAQALAGLSDWQGCGAACEAALALRPDEPEILNLLQRAKGHIERGP